MIINNVTNYSKESKAPPNDMLRMLLKLTLHELKIYLKANEGKFYHQITLNINQDQLKRFQSTLASINSPIWINIGKIYLLSSPLNHFKNFLEIEFTKYFKGGLLCAKVKILDKIPNEFMENCYYKIQKETFNFSNTNFLIEIDKVSWTRKLISCLEFRLRSDCPLKQVAD